MVDLRLLHEFCQYRCVVFRCFLSRREASDHDAAEEENLDVSEEDEELSQAFDMHNIVIASIQQVVQWL